MFTLIQEKKPADFFGSPQGIILLREEPETEVFRFEIDLSTKGLYIYPLKGIHYFLICFYTMRDELIFYRPNELDDPIEVVFDEKRELQFVLNEGEGQFVGLGHPEVDDGRFFNASEGLG